MDYLRTGALAMAILLVANILQTKPSRPKPILRLQFVIKAILFLASVLLSSVLGILAAIVFHFSGHAHLSNYFIGRSFWFFNSCFSGVRCTVQNEHYLNHRPAIFIANHQSSLDILLMGRVFPKHCAVMAKTSMKHYPFLGWYMRLGNSVFIDRKNITKAKDTMAEAAEQIKALKMSVFIFPEGTRSHLKNAQLLPFKKGAFHLAVQAQIPIIPIVFSGYDDVYDSRAHLFPGGTVTIRALEPIETKGMTTDNVEELTKSAHAIMLAALKEISSSTKENESSSKQR